MIIRLLSILFAAGLSAWSADLTGRWSTGRGGVFVLQQSGDTFTGTIEGSADNRTYKVVDGVVRGNQIHFFVLHDDPMDPEVRDNAGKPFHNLAIGTFSEDQIEASGSRENTSVREFHLILKRVKK